MASLTQIAQKAGVSVTAASLVLNKKDHGTRVSEDCAQRIRVIAKELGYVPNYHASSIKKGRSETVAIAMDLGVADEAGSSIVGTHPELQTPYFGLIVGGIEEVMRRRGYLMTLVGPDTRNRAPDRALIGVRQRRFDGMIVLGSLVHVDTSTVLQQAPEQPIVVIEPRIETKLLTIDYDEQKAVEMAVDHLVGLRHKQLLWVGEYVNSGNGRATRQQRFEQYCKKLGIAAETVQYNTPERKTPFLSYHDIPDAAREAMEKHLKAKPRQFTGVVCYNDNVGVGILDALADAGLRVPEDVSVVGHDNFEGRRCRPKLTSVDHCLNDMGVRAAELLMKMIEDPSLVEELRETRELVGPTLVVRGSTGPAPR
jgi:LacI family transcriptional regulator, galactose operon repressor